MGKILVQGYPTDVSASEGTVSGANDELLMGVFAGIAVAMMVYPWKLGYPPSGSEL